MSCDSICLSASEENREGGCWIFGWVVRGSPTKLALEQRSAGEGAGPPRPTAQSAEALKQVVLLCATIKKTRVAGVESGAERALRTEAKVKGLIYDWMPWQGLWLLF